MYPVDASSAAHASARAAAAARGKAVDLSKKYLGALDVVYSATMGRMPRVPQFKREDEDG